MKEDGRLIGALENGTYFYYRTSPGRHHYAVSPVNALFKNEEGSQTIQVSAGEIQYIQAIAQRFGTTVRAVVYAKFAHQAMSAMKALTYATIVAETPKK